MFNKVLIANRGEIALRVIRACRELGVRTVAIYSEADRTALHVRFADEAVCIGPPPAKDSYLHIPAVISAAEITGADAVHPGYGFLAENIGFARALKSHGITFIGPDPEHLAMFGDKLSAKAAARAAGVPLLPGSAGAVSDADEAATVAAEVGYPVLLKAAFGGGGKGMRVARDESELRRSFGITSNEAEAAFGNGAVFIERFLERPRHVEVQVAGDQYGTAIHLGERDCSLQRRHQKLLEEAPAPNLDVRVRDALREAAVRLAENSGYYTVGTCEFLVQDEEFFFLEVNPRIQVEHPVTEQVTGVDLVALQIRLAAGEKMPLAQSDVTLTGHSIEVRINAEDPWTFIPSPGRITGYHAPGGLGVRVDAAVHEHATVQPFYDSMVAKLIVTGKDRAAAIRRLQWAMDEFVVEGIRTTLPMQRQLVADPMFAAVDYHTKTVDSWVTTRGD
ncbi:MAG: acetyl-CoA carboxylase biotin carboxylase subunit [Deltaproteobacteria bacterium]|nr:acetyl-CoA carboxylase biotin carboxylase subunit [Deltaproteobacteria bacterium]HCH64957.1 acetyl-CoA carboxylase biotin carboxylase subunit [Deltaproteobacteria bacterium]